MTSSYRVDRRKPLLDSLRDQGVDLPYGCKYGGCITCAAKLIAGKVDQRAQVALNNRQLNPGLHRPMRRARAYRLHAGDRGRKP